MTFLPEFTTPKGQLVLGYCTVYNDDGTKLDSFELVASGATGKVTKRTRSKPAKAWVDMTEDERKAKSEDEHKVKSKDEAEDEEDDS